MAFFYVFNCKQYLVNVFAFRFMLVRSEANAGSYCLDVKQYSLSQRRRCEEESELNELHILDTRIAVVKINKYCGIVMYSTV